MRTTVSQLSRERITIQEPTVVNTEGFRSSSYSGGTTLVPARVREMSPEEKVRHGHAESIGVAVFEIEDRSVTVNARIVWQGENYLVSGVPRYIDTMRRRIEIIAVKTDMT